MGSRSDILGKIEEERERQFNLPGSEGDVRNTPNEWVAIASHYLSENVRRGNNAPSRSEFEDSLVKAAAVILAALESVPAMSALGHFEGGATSDSFVDALLKLRN
jgi:hypothetical protein